MRQSKQTGRQCLLAASRFLSGRFSLSRPSQTSSTLLESIKCCDQAAWERFVDLYGRTLYGWCRAAGLSDQDSADVIQDTFRAVARGVTGFERDHGQLGAFTAWLWTVTQSRISDHRRRLARCEPAIGGSEAQQYLAEMPDPFSDQSDTFAGTTASSVAMRAAELIRHEFHESTWQAFWRVAIDDQPTDVVATQLNMSVAAVRQANYRVRCRLRQELQGIIAESESSC